MAAILDLVSVDFLTNAWIDWSDLLVAHSVTGGRFLLKIISATHPRWSPSCIWFPLIKRQTPRSIHPIFLWLIGDD
jgi:hypothetical protein